MNILAERSFPSFFKEYAPKLLKFYSDWLDWTELPGNFHYELNHLSSEQDIDESIEAYRTHLKRKLLPEFPERTATDLKLLLKNVLWLYRAKSSRKAYDFMFRILFNSPATIWHPRDTMLKTSDGVWDVPQYAGIVENDEVNTNWLIDNCLGWRMTGKDSRAEAFIAAASSGYSGSIECKASSIKELARVSFYRNYDHPGQELLENLGTIECDPTLNAFRIVNPNETTEMVTAVWSINKEKRTYVFPPGTSVIEIGTKNFLEPQAVVNGDTSSYDAINLEALHGGLWRTVDVSYSNGVLEGKFQDGNGNEHSAFSLSIEYNGDITFASSVPLRRKGEGTAAGLLATFYVKSLQKIVRGGLSRESIKTAPVQLLSQGFGTYCISARSLLSGDDVLAFDGESISILELVAHTDVAANTVAAVEYSFEEPVSNISLSLSYDFAAGKYIVEASKPVRSSIDAICRFGEKSISVKIPAKQTRVEFEADLPDPLVTVGSKNLFGILLDVPTAHFAPGERVRLLNPDTGEVSEIEPVILWHAESEGHYTSTKGFLSDINAVQDNHYWQNYSYVVRSDVGIGQWRNIVKTLLHPAGLEIFGELMIEGTELEDGKGIYYLEEQTYLRKFGLFFEKMVALAKMAIVRTEFILSTSRLAQRHSITTDLWLHWIQSTGDLRADIKELKRLLFNEDDIEERKELERQINELEATLSSPWMEDIRDWYDIRPAEIDEELNANSVLWFRNDGTLINPLIVDWVRFEFTEDIDEPFELRGETVQPKTSSLWGTTLHPLHPMIHGRILGNEYALTDDQEEIPFLYMAFVGSSQESSGVRIKNLVIGNDVLRYSDIARVDIHEPASIKETDLQKYARKFLLGQDAASSSNGIIQWKNLEIPDFIYVDTDGGLVFNRQSLLKVPEAWASYHDRTYEFERSAWNDERISIVSYSPYDFLYRIWIERLNGKIECSITAYNSKTAPGLPLKNSNVHIIPKIEYDADGKEISRKEDEATTELVYVQDSGWNGPATEIYATTRSWKLEFNDPSRVSSWFEINLPEVVDSEQLLCFVNGLLQPKSRIEGNAVSIDTVKDNSSITYSSTRLNFYDLSLEEYILNEEQTGYVLDENGRPKTRLVMVSTNESDNVPFGEITLQDWLVVNEDMDRMKLPDFTLEGMVFNIIGCSISDTLSYAEIYVLAPIEGSRKIQYPWFGWKMEADRDENGLGDVDSNGLPVYVWPFTYDNARIFPYSAHNESITSIRDAELNPDKEAILPKIHWEVQYHNVSRLLNGFQRSTLISETIASQRQSETVDRILNTWFDDATSRLRTDFFKNEHWMAAANFSSTLLFNKEGILIDPAEIDWADCLAHGTQEYGFPQKWWSRPLQAEQPARYGTVSNGGITWSGIEDFDPEGRLVFIDGLKMLDSDIASNAPVSSEMDEKDAIAFSMGRDWLMQNDGQTGWFSLKKDSTGWTVQAKVNGEYASVDHLDRLQEIDLVEFVGLSLGRKRGTIWSADGSTFEIKGSTEVSSVTGDKRRFIDLTFLDKIDIYQPQTTQRLYSVVNSWIFGAVDRIVDVDPRFFMVFIDGKHSPMESHEWRYIKGSFFVEVDPEKSVEVYIGNPYSHLAPDFAKTAPNAIEDLVFNNLRINPVPRHMLTSTLWRMMEVGHMHFGKQSVVEWSKTFSFKSLQALSTYWRMEIQTAAMEPVSMMAVKEINRQSMIFFNPVWGTRFSTEVQWKEIPLRWKLGFLWENRLEHQQTVVNLSETYDDVARWGQMDPSAWAGLDFNPLSKTGKSSIMSFDSDGDLIDPFDVDHHEHLLKPWTVGNVVEVLMPSDTVHMSRIYWPIYEVDPVEHSRRYEGDDRLYPPDSRFYELVSTTFEAAYVDGLAFDIDQHFAKEVQDVHTEEDVYVWPRPDVVFPLGRYAELMEDAGWDSVTVVDMDGEHLLLTDVVADEVQDSEGWTTGVAIDAEHPMARDVQTILENGPFLVSVQRLCGTELVFVDGVKQAEGTFARQARIDGRVVFSSVDPVKEEDVPKGSNVEYAIEILDSTWKDNDEHIVVIYYPNVSWAERHASPEPLIETIHSSIEPDWKEKYNFETFEEYIKSRIVLFCNGSLVRITVDLQMNICINGQPLDEYECSSYELYIADLSNVNCRVAESPLNETDQTFNLDNQQRNPFMETHRTNTLFRMGEVQTLLCGKIESIETVKTVAMSDMDCVSDSGLSNESVVKDNRDTLDHIFCYWSIPVRCFCNPSLYVETISKVDVVMQDDYTWKVLGPGENVDDLDFLAIDVHMLDGSNDVNVLVNPDNIPHVVDGKIVFDTTYVPQSWNFTLYATARENPEWFLPCERLTASNWIFYKGWNQRLEFIGLEPNKEVYIVETYDVSMPGTYTNTDAVYWLEKEFNKKSTLILDNEGLLEHPEGLEWRDGVHIFPHEGTWTAQAEEAEFPAVINELVPDNIKKKQIMELCIDDVIGCNDGLDAVGNCCIDTIVAVNSRIYLTSDWSHLANRDYIYWEEGEFINWIAWLQDDDVFDPHKCFVFVNGFKIPDWKWSYDADLNAVYIPYERHYMIERLGFVKKKDMYDERIHQNIVHATLIDPDLRTVQELEEDVPVIVESYWTTWKDREGFPVWGEVSEIPADDDTEVLVDRPDPREGIIWPIARIWKYFNSCTSEGIDIPEYLGHDLSKYVLAWVNGRNVQCIFDGTRIYVPGCETAETVEVYVFELHDGAWIERFNAVPESFTLTSSFRDLKVC